MERGKGGREGGWREGERGIDEGGIQGSRSIVDVGWKREGGRG